MPDRVIIEPGSGYAVNIPVELQNYPGWWDDPVNIETVRRILELRRVHDVTLVDALSSEDAGAPPSTLSAAVEGPQTEQPSDSRPPEPGDYIAARVDGWDITQAEIENYDIDGPDPETLLAHRDMPELRGYYVVRQVYGSTYHEVVTDTDAMWPIDQTTIRVIEPNAIDPAKITPPNYDNL